VGLLFAGSSSSTIANPIGEVLSKVGTALGHSVGFVGGTCSSTVAQPSGGQGLQLPQQAIDHAGKVLEQNRHDLMSKPRLLGVGLGALEDNSQAAVIVYVDKTSSAKPQLPERVDNVPVRVIFTDPFIAFRSGATIFPHRENASISAPSNVLAEGSPLPLSKICAGCCARCKRCNRNLLGIA
jgi:hypothetical protein